MDCRAPDQTQRFAAMFGNAVILGFVIPYGISARDRGGARREKGIGLTYPRAFGRELMH